MNVFRKSIRIFSSAVCLALLAATITLPTTTPAQSLEERVVEYRLDNGFLFLLAPMPNQAPTFAGTIIVKVGGVDEPLGQTGLAHMFEHVAFKGTPWIGTMDYEAESRVTNQIDSVAMMFTQELAEIPTQYREILVELERRTRESLRAVDEGISDSSQEHAVAAALTDTLSAVGADTYSYLAEYVHVRELYANLADLQEQHRQYAVKDEFSQIVKVNGGVGLNAGTGKDYTIYYEQFPTNRLELWAMLESQRFMYPVMREFYSERNVVVEERRMRTDDDPEGKLYEAFMGTAMLAHPYRMPTIGWMSDIEQASAGAAREFRAKYYVPENCVGALVGNFDVEVAKELLNRYFGPIPAAVQPVPRVKTIEPQQIGVRRVEVLFDAEPQLMMGYHKPNYPDPEAYVFTVIANIVRDMGNSSRFYQELVKTGLATSASVYEELPGQRYPNLFMVQATPIAPHTTEELEGEILRILNALATDGPTELELQKAKNVVQARYIRGLEDNAGLARNLVHAQSISGDWRLLVQHTKRVDAVTAEDVRQVAARYFQPEARTVGTLVRPDADTQ
jgi:predicted Zn-dependent peptidase